MRERIYTIPLIDVVVAGGGCPFCRLAGQAEVALPRVYLDGMLMDSGWRGQVLESWLCRRHLAAMQGQVRKLGGAIVVQALLRKALRDLDAGRGPLPGWGSTCVACQDIDRTLIHHAEAFVHAWLVETGFRDLVATADPFCLPHLTLVMRQASRGPRRERELVQAELLRWEKKALEALLAKVDWFVRKFDARFQDAPWDGAEDAVERAVVFLTSGNG